MKREIEFLPLKTFVFDDAADAAESAAREMANWVRTRRYQRADAVLGFSAADSLGMLYQKIVEMSVDETKGGLAVSGVRTIVHEELMGFAPGSPGSIGRWLDERLFGRWPAQAKHRFQLDGSLEGEALEAHCAACEEWLKNEGPVDVMLVPLRSDGSLGLNAPGTPLNARTRVVDLSDALRADVSSSLGGLDVPARALTLGPASIRGSKRVRVYAFGEDKAELVEQAMLPDPDPAHPLSLMVGHKDFELLLDPAAASALE
ncbi:6-phosphogluconolactonase [Engelhardtia mirabilis]|uniref:Glucosamine-6-phosphate deaminase 1 n=1 Tax=Engelhardtia mirabilis TaxID=2528011 RepID=A0A518BG37_9BACT|nr:Glucosamine-6-phosphate deaminase 1 [Planctomycetes bacterium Pla133]QDV00265.1 Glucosamine-6-phosphate deaminase 1 [Planctomycetes bacterium Pla86]